MTPEHWTKNSSFILQNEMGSHTPLFNKLYIYDDNNSKICFNSIFIDNYFIPKPEKLAT